MRDHDQFFPQIQGGAQFRGGIRRCDLANADQTTLSGYTGSDIKIVPYVCSDPTKSGEIILVAGQSSVKFIQRSSDSAITVTSKTITPMSSLGFPDNSSNGIPQQNMHYAQVGDRLYFTDPSGVISPFVFITKRLIATQDL